MSVPSIQIDAGASKFDWLNPARCRIILIAWLLACAITNVLYLNRNCPIDLSGDEAQYWDWSRRLDLSYYSKGPLVAYLIRASCAVFGETMPAVRYPAIALGAGTSIFAYLLTLKLFQSDRLALGAVLLSNLVPLMIFGQIFMTIDAPLFFCWAAATYFAALAIFDQKNWAWVCVGIFAGFGFLAKYAMFLWIPSLFLFLLSERGDRHPERYSAKDLGNQGTLASHPRSFASTLRMRRHAGSGFTGPFI